MDIFQQQIHLQLDRLGFDGDPVHIVHPNFRLMKKQHNWNIFRIETIVKEWKRTSLCKWNVVCDGMKGDQYN